ERARAEREAAAAPDGEPPRGMRMTKRSAQRPLVVRQRQGIAPRAERGEIRAERALRRERRAGGAILERAVAPRTLRDGQRLAACGGDDQLLDRALHPHQHTSLAPAPSVGSSASPSAAGASFAASSAR